MDEMRHLLRPEVYKEIMKEYEQRKRELVAEVLNQGDRREFTPLHVAAYQGNYALVRHYLKLGADPNRKDVNQRTPLDLAKDKFSRKVLSNLNEAAYTCDD